MDARILELIEQLNRIYQESFEYRELKRVSRILEEDLTLNQLKEQIDDLLSRLSTLVLASSSIEEILLLQTELQALKLQLDTNPLVIQYNQAFKAVRMIDNHLNQKLFSLFSKKRGHSCG